MGLKLFELDSLKEAEKVAVENLREFVRIPSVHPNPDYEPCVNFLKRLAQDIGLEFNVYRPYPKKPVVIITWIGKEPTLPSIMLNSHMDVVPVFVENWDYDPFAADIDNEGNIYGRGTQDTKSHGIEYLEAIRKLKTEGQSLKRTVHVSFVPDEEIRGAEGMASFVETEDFRKLNVVFALDEGMPGDGDVHWVSHGERWCWSFNLHIAGTAGHGSLLLENTTGEKLNYLLTKIYDFRKEESLKVTDLKSLGLATSINVTVLQGGVQNNVVPSDISISVDCRISQDIGMERFEKQFRQWCQEAGDGMVIKDIYKDKSIPVTPIDNSNPYWIAFKGALEGMNYSVSPFILYCTVDASFLRSKGLLVLDYSPNQDIPLRYHADNEMINVKIFLKSIDIYSKIIPSLANV